jgi:hypothetical protein
MFAELCALASHDITGKIASWEACRDDALRRDSFWQRRQAFLEALPATEKARLANLESKPRDDSMGEAPGSERNDEEERVTDSVHALQNQPLLTRLTVLDLALYGVAL